MKDKDSIIEELRRRIIELEEKKNLRNSKQNMQQQLPNCKKL